jgi:PiT family inorganic phosphate transporter
MFGLEGGLLILLLFSLFAACAFEFVNGFHDTANAVATVIYTRSLKPQVAVIWSGFCNFLGVNIGGIGVAMGILNLLPTDLMVDHNISHGMAMIIALLLSAIVWNLGTWWLGLPASSSHTLIGSILGVGLGHGFLTGGSINDSVNWHKASEIGLSLLFSPLFGFAVAYGLLALLLKWLLKKQPILFQEPPKDHTPPILIRIMLFVTCSLVSFFHGSNDGQKGVGLVMLILIVLVPGYFALDNSLDISKLHFRTAQISTICQNNAMQTQQIKSVGGHAKLADSLANQLLKLDKVKQADLYHNLASDLRTAIVKTTKGLEKIEKKEVSKADLKILKAAQKDLKPYIEYAPKWVIIMISICLGLGTMVGWKRIVVTIGEKIGKEHLTYAQGAVAELIAAGTIGLSSGLGLPVSTTHVLSSGIAGTMVATNGAKNLQAKTVKNIALAWVLTLPVTILMSCGLFMLIWNVLK